MLKKFTLRNYKNFKDDITIDFSKIAGYQFSTDCLSNGLITKMLIYGRNATGKTNLGKAIMDIRSTMFGGIKFTNNEVFLNADSEENIAFFSYTFCFSEKELVYCYSRDSDEEIQSEELIIDGTTIFKCDFYNDDYNFDNLKIIDADTANIDRYLQSLEINDEQEDDIVLREKLPFLRWLLGNVALDNNSILILLANYVRRMVMVRAGNQYSGVMSSANKSFYESLENEERLKDFEDFLNAMGIDCKLILKTLPHGEKELYFDHNKLVPFFKNASSGTLALVGLYRKLVPSSWDASLMFLDEFDAFYHYEMAENVIKFFKRRYPKSQIIMTTHNTNLMTNRLMRPDCLFILSRKGTLTALCDATLRELREGHNLEKMYISGEFDKYE